MGGIGEIIGGVSSIGGMMMGGEEGGSGSAVYKMAPPPPAEVASYLAMPGDVSIFGRQLRGRGLLTINTITGAPITAVSKDDSYSGFSGKPAKTPNIASSNQIFDLGEAFQGMIR